MLNNISGLNRTPNFKSIIVEKSDVSKLPEHIQQELEPGNYTTNLLPGGKDEVKVEDGIMKVYYDVQDIPAENGEDVESEETIGIMDNHIVLTSTNKFPEVAESIEVQVQNIFKEHDVQADFIDTSFLQSLH